MAVAQCSLKQKKDFVFLKVVYDDYAEPTDSVITREHHFELPFKCNFSRKDNQNLDVLPERRLLPSLFSKKGISHQNLNFQRHIKLPATGFSIVSTHKIWFSSLFFNIWNHGSHMYEKDSK